MIRTILTRILGGFVLAVTSLLISAQAPDLGATADRLPPLARSASTVKIPLDGTPAWRGVRDGVETKSGAGGLAVSYQIAPGQPAGAALVFAPGSLKGIRMLRIRATGDRSMQLIPTLQTRGGAAFAFPAVAITKGRRVEIDLAVSELGYFAPQSKADEPEDFTPADAMMLTILDISGFTGGSGAATFTIESIEGVL